MRAIHPYFKSNSDIFQLQVKQRQVTSRIRNYDEARYEVSIKTTGEEQCFEYLGLRSEGIILMKEIRNQEIYMLNNEQNLFGCKPYSKKEMMSIRGKMLLVNRGQCQFIDKVKYAQEAGAKSVLFLNHQQGSRRFGASSRSSSDDDDDDRVIGTIPSFMISYEDAISLLNSNRKQPIQLDISQLPSVDNDLNAIISLLYRGERIKNIVIINV
ncbi:hypothetical protein BD770DRAFT_103473 [Pilaira anomala]|nr:hypothetical protein BD770DRAFT_103473 [Pilaira anomala]